MKKSVLFGFAVAGLMTACNNIELVPVAMTATINEASMRVIVDAQDSSKYTVQQENGTVKFNVAAGSAGLNVEGMNVVVYDQSQAKLGEQSFPLNVLIEGSPDKPREESVTLNDFFLPLTAKTKLEQSCLINYNLGENCPSVNVQITFVGTSTASGQRKQVPLNFVFQAEAANGASGQ